jgi:hypothetical protein
VLGQLDIKAFRYTEREASTKSKSHVVRQLVSQANGRAIKQSSSQAVQQSGSPAIQAPTHAGLRHFTLRHSGTKAPRHSLTHILSHTLSLHYPVSTRQSTSPSSPMYTWSPTTKAPLVASYTLSEYAGICSTPADAARLFPGAVPSLYYH